LTVCTNRFEALARATAAGLGIPNIPLVVVSHPIGGIGSEEVIAQADSILEKVISGLTG